MKRHAMRQYPFYIGGHVYFADIFAKKHGVVIEIDGGYHLSDHQTRLDKERDKLMASIGIRVYRISNADVDDKDSFRKFKDMLCKLLPPKATHFIRDEERAYLSNADDIETMINAYGYVKIDPQSLFKLKYER